MADDEVPVLGPEAAVRRLRALHATGRLAARYVEVPGLLAQITTLEHPWPQLAVAGRLLADADPAEVVGRWTDPGPAPVPVSVAVTGHGTLAGLMPALCAQLARHNLVLRGRLGDLDGYRRELLDPAGVLADPEIDLVLCVLDPDVLLHRLPLPWQVEDVERASTELLEELARSVAGYLGRGTGMLVLNTVPLLPATVRQVLDLGRRARLGAAWRRFNTGLLDLAADHPRLVVVDLDPLVAAGGPVQDVRMAGYAKAYLGDELLGRYAREIGHLTRALHGLSRKVLALDLDGTLWDGVLAEDGPEGVVMAGTPRGETFGRVQRVVRQLGSQGVLAVLASKNDQDAVLTTLRDHPDLHLREEHLVAVEAGWDPKTASLRRVAHRLGVGLDSVVFVDDSPAECGSVREALPQVAVVGLDDEPALHVERILADGWFDALRLTEDDRLRPGRYRSRVSRQDLLAEPGSLAEHLRRLDVSVRVAPAAEADAARVAQLTVRTNQFNLTTRRLRPDEIVALVRAPGSVVLTVRARDRFGDDGLVGSVLGRLADDGLHIDNMVLSCRVLGRGIEQATVAGLLDRAREAGLPAAHGRYEPSSRNGRVADFYPSLGFREVAADGPGRKYRHDLDRLPPVPDHVRLNFYWDAPWT